MAEYAISGITSKPVRASEPAPPGRRRAPIRVCEVIKGLNLGGAETALAERLRVAPQDGVTYTVICLHASWNVLIDRIRAEGIEVIDLSPYSRLSAYVRLVRVVRRLAPQVVNMHSPLPAIVLRLFLRPSRRKPHLIHTVSGIKYRPATLLLDRLTRRLDDHTVAVASMVAHSPTAVGARRVSVRIHGIDLGRQREWAARAGEVRGEFGVPDDAFLVVSVANLRACKNHLMLVEAAAEVVRARPDALFLLAGEGPMHDQISAEIERRGLGDHVRLLGRVPDAYRLIASADLLVLSSHNEGLPVVAMEALGAGVPVVATDVGGLPDIITSGRNGILTSPGSPSALAAGLLEAMEPAEHRKLRSGALSSDPQMLDMVNTARWFEDLYQDPTRG
ncbi:glycosyltransferase [Sphaerisporangium fuscum]|uniref:glycosyltransferase n=1 Tax=Sphaerisporangium fuscum TaxID=2835868 RepID=UPI001BDD7D0D|nr:glycosyltransferase [Sphaerisporangium fuscum]